MMILKGKDADLDMIGAPDRIAARAIINRIINQEALLLKIIKPQLMPLRSNLKRFWEIL
jgi:hypothetical protein